MNNEIFFKDDKLFFFKVSDYDVHISYNEHEGTFFYDDKSYKFETIQYTELGKDYTNDNIKTEAEKFNIGVDMFSYMMYVIYLGLMTYIQEEFKPFEEKFGRISKTNVGLFDMFIKTITIIDSKLNTISMLALNYSGLFSQNMPEGNKIICETTIKLLLKINNLLIENYVQTTERSADPKSDITIEKENPLSKETNVRCSGWI